MTNRLPNKYRHDPLADDGQRGPRRRAAPADAGGVAERMLHAASRAIASHPVAYLGAAFATGLLLGKLVKR